MRRLFLLFVIILPQRFGQELNLRSSYEIKKFRIDYEYKAGLELPKTVILPYSFNAYDGISMAPYYQGEVMFSTDLNKEIMHNGKSLFLSIGSACLRSKTFLNKELIGQSNSGFTRQNYLLNGYLKDNNELVIATDNRINQGAIPITSD